MDKVKVKQEPENVNSSTKKVNSSNDSIKVSNKISKPSTISSSSSSSSATSTTKTTTKHSHLKTNAMTRSPNIMVKTEIKKSMFKKADIINGNNNNSCQATNSSSSDYEPPSRVKKMRQNNALNNNISSTDKILEFMVQVPKLTDGVHNDDSSKFSSPFNSRVDTAGTNLTFLTKAGNTEADDYRFKSNGNNNKEKVTLTNSQLNNEYEDNSNDFTLKTKHFPPGLKFRDSSEQADSGDNLSFISSPCAERKIKQKRKKIFEVDTDSMKKQKVENVTTNDETNNENISLISNNATDGSEETPLSRSNLTKRPSTPKKYCVDDKPIYEYMEGEDVIYHEIMGKKNNTEEFDDNEKQFFDFVHLNFDQWCEKSIEFNKEYENLMKKVILARMKFDKRVKFLKNNLDTFALNLEKYGTEINKRSEILKEYCSKIVDEIE